MPDGAGAEKLQELDLIQPFLLESSGIRGGLVRLGPAVDHILTRHAYPEPLAALLGEMLALTAMLGSIIKYDGVFSLQTKGEGAVSAMITDATSKGHLRGYAGFDGDRLDALLADRAQNGATADLGVPELLGAGHLAFTVDQGPQTERYQGIVELTGETLADCLQHYFLQSEQIQSGLLAASERTGGAWRAAGIILQRLPEESAGKAPPDEDAWRRTMILQASCTPGELMDPALPANDLLYRLFHEEGVRVFRRRPLEARCRCSRKRLVETLRAMPRERIEELKVGGKVIVTCEFCNRSYRFNQASLDRIYTAAP